jgi:hypothetical protein
MGIVRNYKNKIYIRIPFGEIQYGKITRSIVVLFRRKRYWIKKMNLERAWKYYYE